MSLRGVRLAAVVASLALAVGCSERPVRVEQIRWGLTHRGQAVGQMSVECSEYRAITLCTQVIDIGDPGATPDQLQRTAVLSRQHPRTRYVQFLQHELGLARSYERERTRHHPRRGMLELDAIAQIGRSGRVWAARPVVHPLTGEEAPLRCVASPAEAGAALLWCSGRWGHVLAWVSAAGTVDWIRNALGVEALREATDSPCDADCRGRHAASMARAQVGQEREIVPGDWRAGARIDGPISAGAALDVPGRQRAWVAPGRSHALVYVMQEPALASRGSCLDPDEVERIRDVVRAVPPGRNPSTAVGPSADCTEDAMRAAAELQARGCAALAVYGYARGAGVDGWHAWVEVAEARGSRTLDPRSGLSPVPAGWVRAGYLDRADRAEADADVLQMRFMFLEPAAVLAQIEAEGSGAPVAVDGP